MSNQSNTPDPNQANNHNANKVNPTADGTPTTGDNVNSIDNTAHEKTQHTARENDHSGVGKPATDISLINDSKRAAKYDRVKSAKPSFFMQRGYQILLVLALITAFLLAMVYQTLFGKIEQPQQMITVEQGETYYGLLPQWQKHVPLFSASIAKLYIKSQVNAPLHAGMYQLPENPTMTEALHILQQGAKTAMVGVQIIEGRQVSELYNTLQNTPGITLEVLPKSKNPDGTINSATLAALLGLEDVLPDAVKTSQDPIVNHNLEGWFAPETYYYAEGTSDKTILLDLYQRPPQIR